MPRNALLKLFRRAAARAGGGTIRNEPPFPKRAAAQAVQSRVDTASARGTATHAKAQRTPMRIEEIEPRILHSADLAPALLGDPAAGQVQMRVIEAPVAATPEAVHADSRHEIVF